MKISRIIKNRKTYWYRFQYDLREELNKYFAPHRNKKLLNPSFTIISNNCWGGCVYRYLSLPYTSPTIGLYLFSDDFIKLVYNLKHYMESELSFISYTQSKHRKSLEDTKTTTCPIGVIDDIEIVFLHYNSPEEAYEKWNKRKKRIIWDNIYYKMSEQNECSLELMKKFDQLPVSLSKKVQIVTRDYGLESQIIFGPCIGKKEVIFDTFLLTKYINIVNFFNNKPYKRKQAGLISKSRQLPQ